MRVLLICDDYWHPGNIPQEGVSVLAKQGYKFDIISNAENFSSESLAQYHAVLLTKCDEMSQTDKTPWKTEKVQKAFADYVESGGGLIAVHSGVVAGENTSIIDKLIGCRFIFHPNVCPVTVSPIKNHPVTENTESFCEIDEHYKIEIITDDADIFLASYSAAQGEESKYTEDPYNNCPAQLYAAGYTRRQGKGRVCVLTPGHNLQVWQNPQFQKLLANALTWCRKQ